MEKFAVVILAAGKGKRMGGDLPKVLRLVKSKPIITHLVDSVMSSGVGTKPVVIVCDEHTFVQDTLGDKCVYAVQAEQLGTGHAVSCAKDLLRGQAEKVIVLYGDMPLITNDTIKRLTKSLDGDTAMINMFTTEVADWEEWRRSFYNFGRIIRDESGKIAAIREKKDCAEAELMIKEINPGLYSFDAEWLWQNLAKLDNENAQSEFYLTDLIKIAIADGKKIGSLIIDARECVGINTPEELFLAESLI